MDIFKLFGTIAIKNEEANENIDETTKKAEKSESKIKKAFEAIGKGAVAAGKAIGGAAVAIGTAFVGVTESTREYRAEMKKLETAFEVSGLSSEAAKEAYSELNAILGDSGQAVEAATHLSKLVKTQEDLQKWTNVCTGVYANFGASLPIEGLTEAANETAKTGQLTGSLADALNWAGGNEEAFQEALDRCSNEQERQRLILGALNNMYAESGETYKKNNAELIKAEKAQERLTDAMARIGAVCEPIMTNVKIAIAGMAEAAVPVVQSMIVTFGKMVDKAMEIYDSVSVYFPVIQEIIFEVFDRIGAIWNRTLQPCLLEIWSYIVEILVPTFRTAFMEMILPAIQTAFEYIVDFWNRILQPCLTAIWSCITETLMPAFQSVFNYLSEHKTVLEVIGIVLGSFATAWGIVTGAITLWNTVGTIATAVTTGLGAAVAFLTSPVTIVIAVLGALIAVGVLLYKNWDEVKQKCIELYEKLSETFERIKEKITEKIEFARDKVKKAVDKIREFLDFDKLKTSILKKFDDIKNGIKEKIEWAKDKVSSAIEKIKGLFNFSWSLPRPKLPRFTLTGNFDLVPPDISLPRIGLEWYEKGGVLTEPTAFGINPTTGKIMVGGEKEPEAVAPISVLKYYVEEAVSNQLTKILSSLEDEEEMVLYAEINNYMDGKKIASELAETVIKKISQKQLNKQRAVGLV